ncbi:unnamed protein product [Fraxinus pennsylvanica]|uniref:AB hydrolase-1 domain-containing protein n=1 Tax=Fraxinus pennsylvanica TaxID=56036 RepID=A0AAD1Z9E5_9LAMI|nr:unnamed protein product [Fraxinus pennsylvanica]
MGPHRSRWRWPKRDGPGQIEELAVERGFRFVNRMSHWRLRKRIHLLWGENDQIFKLELAQKMKEQLGDKATVEGIEKAGHLVHLERPCVYNSCLNNFLSSFHANANANANQFSF